MEQARAEHDTPFAWLRALCEQVGILSDERIRETMARANMRKAEAGPYVVTITKPRARVEMDEGAKIPEVVRIVETSERLDKREAKRIIAAGGNLPGVRLVEGREGVRIK